MDINQFDTSVRAESGIFLHLVHPSTDQKLVTPAGDPVGILLRGRDSKHMREVEHRLNNKRLEHLRLGFRGKIKGLSSSEENEEVLVEILTEATLEFRNIERDGKPLPTTKEQVRAFYKHEGFRWIREQADEFYNRTEALLGEQ